MTPKTIRILCGLVLAISMLTANAAHAAGTIQIQNAYARATPAGADTGAVYVTIVNQGANDTLVGASTDAAGMAMLHSMNISGGTMHMEDMKGGLAVPAGQTVTLLPGHDHIMLMGLKHPLVAGDKIHLILQFQKAGNVPVDAIVKPLGND